ncbi:MAG: branched-chain amino acid transaminase [Candidatus Micrarchaeota archaeon]|nr:branched-chain amino acid transaminase [Candidatus Micrarchaeota archaeon]
MSIPNAKFIWFNGRIVKFEDAKIHALSHCVQYGSGVFEGMRCYETHNKKRNIFRAVEHFRRFHQSANTYYMKIPYSIDELIEATKSVIKENDFKECFIRPWAGFGLGALGLNPKNNPVDVVIAAFYWGKYLGEDALEKGIRAMTSSWSRINQRILPTTAKASGHYLNSMLAKREALERNFDEAIMLNIDGYVAEGSGENIFMVKSNKIITPPISSGCLPGITRDAVMQIAKKYGYQVYEENLTRDMLYHADEVFFTGNAAEITPVVQIDHMRIGNGTPGNVTKDLQDKFFKIIRREIDEFNEWMTIF